MARCVILLLPIVCAMDMPPGMDMGMGGPGPRKPEKELDYPPMKKDLPYKGAVFVRRWQQTVMSRSSSL